MSERIRRLAMSAFRGVPAELEIDLEPGRSLVVFGENGTGKSTIADALEWYFTGAVELLTHEGRQHAIRHVGAAKAQETSVSLTTSGELGGTVVFGAERDPAPITAAGRETFLLRGRTLADFINKTKTEKLHALTEILGLDAVESMRQDLQGARTELRKRAKAAEQELEACQRLLAPSDSEVSEDDLLANLQAICEGLGITAPDTLDRVTDTTWLLSAGAARSRPGAAQQQALIAADVEVLAEPAIDLEAIRRWNEITAGETEIDRVALLRGAQALLDRRGAAEGCPVCGQKVAAKTLASRIRKALEELSAAAFSATNAAAAVREQLDVLASALELRDELRTRAALLGLRLASTPELGREELDRRLADSGAIAEGALTELSTQVAAWDAAARAAFVAATPQESSASETQLAMLAALCEQIRAWLLARQRAAAASRARDLIDRVFDAYQEKQQATLSSILDQINARVAAIYDSLHPGEGLGHVTVEPWTAKGVELAIDFYGSRQRPPHGVLSESHLNSLAIALFLAMAETFNEKLRFLVLDDVINSLDIEHRVTLAGLLAAKDDWQLIVLTHDRQFFEHLAGRAPSWKRMELTSWSFLEGPRTKPYETRGLIDEARRALESGDLGAGAAKARRALEEQLQETCEKLQAHLPFRRGVGNDRRDLVELFEGLRRTLKDHAKPLLKELEPLLRDLEADVRAVLNVEVHASRGRAAVSEIDGALKRIEALDRRFTCPSCDTRVWNKGTVESFRCRCGKSVFPPVQ